MPMWWPIYSLREAAFPITRQRFEARVQRARLYLRHIGPQLIHAIESLFETHRQIRLLPSAYPEMEADLARLMPPNFLRHTPYDQVLHLSRFLKASLISRRTRAHRSAEGSPKGRTGSALFAMRWRKLMDSDLTGAKREAVEEFSLDGRRISRLSLRPRTRHGPKSIAQAIVR